ncbi:LytTR family transcriptional regulator DNA-binding domain-containing protein [Flavobacterium sp.]|uniref:LytTR family transcriptional regulator DNA-binding domain-containing protein n=1 Tax=Flavobacterium sp. TaxID=239 RepID=UPI003D6A52CA
MNKKRRFLTFLEQPYPFYYEGKKLLEITGIIFSICLLFNYMLQPFDVNTSEHKMPYFWICMIHSATPVLLLLCISFVWGLFPKVTEDWKIRKECLFILFLILLTGICQFLIRDIIYDNPRNWSWGYFTEEVLNSFIAGFFLAPIIISINLNRQQLKNQQKANRILEAMAEVKEIQSGAEVWIETEVKSEKFSFDSTNFIYAKAEGNYAEIYIKGEQGIHKFTKRIALKNLEAQLCDFPFIIKTHRSILLNRNFIGNVSGNAQGYKVTLKDCPDTVPVSRNYIQSFESETIMR